jgi:ribosome-binding protein aMBF1 (putative translation factor)
MYDLRWGLFHTWVHGNPEIKGNSNMRDYEPFRRHLASSIMEKRLHMGLSQEDLAKRANLHRTYISDVERGERNISVDSLRRLAVALGLPMWQLLKQAEEQLGDIGGDLVVANSATVTAAN